MKSSLEEFESLLEEQFGQKLTPQAKDCVEDIYNNYENFIDNIREGAIIIIASPLVLSQKIPNSRFSIYHTIGGISIISALIGLVLLFFFWKLAIGIFLVSIVLKYLSRKIKYKTANDFANEIMLKFQTEVDEGMFDVTQYYIAGIIQLKSQLGNAHLPLLPSCSLTGIDQFAKTH